MFLIVPSNASKNGMGELKIEDEIMDYIIQYYFNTENKADKPGGLAITKNGDMIGWAVCPAKYAGDCIFRDLEPLRYCRENVKTATPISTKTCIEDRGMVKNIFFSKGGPQHKIA